MSRPLPNPTVLAHHREATTCLKRAHTCTENRDPAGHARWMREAQGHTARAADADPAAKRYTGFANRRPRRDA